MFYQLLNENQSRASWTVRTPGTDPKCISGWPTEVAVYQIVVQHHMKWNAVIIYLTRFDQKNWQQHLFFNIKQASKQSLNLKTDEFVIFHVFLGVFSKWILNVKLQFVPHHNHNERIIIIKSYYATSFTN